MKQSVLVVEKTRPVLGQVSVPGDKSISHRAILLGSLAEGETVISNFLFSEDCLHTMSCLRELGAEIEVTDHTVVIQGKGPYGLGEPANILDVGNSGTSIRLLAGVLAGLGHYAVLTGDASIRSRPMKRIVEPLRRMGATVVGRRGGELAPLTILPGHRLHGIHYATPVASAQVKSCVLLAGLLAEGQTSVFEPSKSRDHTERMLRQFGVTVEENGNEITVYGGSALRGAKVDVPGDISSAAFVLAAAALIPDSRVKVVGVGLNPTRTGFLDVLAQMGAKVKINAIPGEIGLAEPVGDVTVEYAPLSAVEIDGPMIPRLVDEVPILAVLAACARGKTIIRNAEELRYKESDRLASVCEGLAKFGVEATTRPDGLEITGTQQLKCPREVDSHQDHRIAMSMSVLAARAVLRGGSPVTIRGASAIDISFPGFVDVMRSLGIYIQLAA